MQRRHGYLESTVRSARRGRLWQQFVCDRSRPALLDSFVLAPGAVMRVLQEGIVVDPAPDRINLF
jgi:hypothetical protein